METGSYKELQSKEKTSRFVAVLITLVTVMLCLLIGMGSWILVAGNREGLPIAGSTNDVVEEVVIVETIAPKETNAKVVQHPAEMDFKEGLAKNSLDTQIREEVQDAIKLDEAGRQSFRPEDNPFLKTLVEITSNVASEFFNRFNEKNEEFFSTSVEETETGDEVHSRSRRSIPLTMAMSAVKYMSYASFGKFMYDEIYSITEYAVEGRKLSGDADADFLDGFWPLNSLGQDNVVMINEKVDSISGEATAVESSAKPSNRPASAYDNGWTPMVNKVSLRFITDMLSTLLNLMREYLLRDNVMECLWYMFCKDVNHQAKYTDPMGYLARINSVGLKVLTDKEGREADTVAGVWRALTQWQPLQCEGMFPKCDGSKALEIVNEVASASRK